MDFPIHFGHYLLLGTIAAGGMARVFVANDTRTDRRVVVKRLLPRLIGDEYYESMFIDEARLTMRLSHPNIVAIHDIGKHQGEPFLVMEHIDGVDLRAALQLCAERDKRISAELAGYILCEVLDALDYAHAQIDDTGGSLGIVHRDVSPSNILLSRHGEVKLIDFGIAFAAGRQHRTKAGEIKGKLAYMSPEQLRGGHPDPRSDIFSAGAVLATMLLGRPVFAAPRELDLLLMVREARLERLERYGGHIDVELDSILRRAMAQDARDRHHSAGHLRDELLAWLRRRRRPPSERSLARMVASLLRWQSPESQPDIHLPSTSETEALARRPPSGITAAPPRNVLYLPNRPHDRDPGDHELTDFRGDLARTPTISLLHSLITSNARGLLVVTADDLRKEVYLSEGVVDYVSCNIASESFGAYLVQRGVISQYELERALVARSNSGATLETTLVRSRTLDLVSARHHLADLVRERLIDLCTWTTGRYAWHAARTCPGHTVALPLDIYGILARGALCLDHEPVTRWRAGLDDTRSCRMLASPRHPLLQSLGAFGRQLLADLDRRSLAQLESHYIIRNDADRLWRALYLLHHTGLLESG